MARAGAGGRRPPLSAVLTLWAVRTLTTLWALTTRSTSDGDGADGADADDAVYQRGADIAAGKAGKVGV